MHKNDAQHVEHKHVTLLGTPLMSELHSSPYPWLIVLEIFDMLSGGDHGPAHSLFAWEVECAD